MSTRMTKTWFDGEKIVTQEIPEEQIYTIGPLYIPPPQRPWVGLTDDEIALIVAECASSAHRHDDFSFARAIEAALKERNHD